MRIAQVSPVFESVPPKLYGGTERMVSYLSEELVSLGHEVFLFASGDSLTQAKLISPCESSLRLNKTESSFVYYQTVQLQQLYDWREHFDIVHFHTELFHLPMSHLAKWPHLTTLHGRLDTQEFQHSSRFFPEAPFVSISHYQKTQAPDLNWLSTVYHGLPENKYHLGNGEGAYLAFLGRICQDKGILEAIEIAYQTGMPLKIAAKIDNTNYDFYKSFVEKHFKSSLIEYVGEINDQEKNEFLGKAKTLLFPISWPEPFGLVMIEAMACGTPVWHSHVDL
jgi:glycosyltransferase involved in cell wall biosynthesis